MPLAKISWLRHVVIASHGERTATTRPPSAKTVVLELEFKNRAADEAGIALLERIQVSTTA